MKMYWKEKINIGKENKIIKNLINWIFNVKINKLKFKIKWKNN
jgi:hypothetical protein